jgi:adenosine deaminase
MTVRTDLHTHFAGTLAADELIALGLEHNVSLDVQTAKNLEIVDHKYSGGAIPLVSLDRTQMEKLKEGLELNAQKKSLFDNLDAIYANRSFITKNKDLFIPLVEKIAESYQKQGVAYTELSYAGVISNPQLLQSLHENLPRIEANTGVKVRFLGALWRHSDRTWNLDEVDRLKGVLMSPYVVGLDVMGHEKNPIRDMTDPLNEIIDYAAKHIPGCVVRLHAGENPYYSADPATINEYNFNNAYESVQIADRARRNEDKSFIGTYGEEVQIRLGHGRYGLDPMTLDLMKEANAMSEFCLSSNLLLNHTDSYKGPFDLYNSRGLSYVLGSDGYGMYTTSMPREYELAVKAGMNGVAVKTLEDTETRILAGDQKRFEQKAALWKQYESACLMKGVDPFKTLETTIFNTEDGAPRWNPSIANEKKKAVDEKHGALLSAMEGIGIHTDKAEVEHLLKTARISLFSGASKSSWKNVPEDQQKNVEDTMREYISQLDGRVDAIMTGGTDYGFEAVIHRLVEERNKTLSDDQKIPVIGAFALEANINEIRQGTLSHAFVLRYGDTFAGSWMDQSPALMDIATVTGARVIMCGGGQVIRDMIIDASDRGLISGGQVFLFAGITGASGEKADQYPNAKFQSIDELRNRISGVSDSKVFNVTQQGLRKLDAKF